jgi:pimeloyl-ACP methyl ester carboxylesterase
MPTLVRDDGVRLHYSIHGADRSRPPLLLTHGFGASEEMWGPNLEALAADRRALTWDMRGHARSQAPSDPRAYGVKESVGDMRALLELLDARTAVLVGMSLGGYLSLAFLDRHPERVQALVLVDTGPGFRREEPRTHWNAYVERLAVSLERDGLSALASRSEVGRHTDAGGLVNTARSVMAQHDAHVIESLDRIDVPTLVIVGAEDADFLRPAEYMARRIPGARIVVLESAGHAANMDAAADFNAAVRGFLAELE